MAELTVCPRCGSSDGVYVKGQMRGPVTIWYSQDDGAEEETIIDKTYVVSGKLVYCGMCNKPRRDLQIGVGRNIVEPAPAGGEARP